MTPRIRYSQDDYLRHDDDDPHSHHYPSVDLKLQSKSQERASSSRRTIKGFLFRILAFLLLLLLLTGMISSALSLYDFNHYFHLTPSATTTMDSFTIVLRQGIISWVWSLINWMPMSNNLRLELQQRCWDASDASASYLFHKNTSYRDQELSDRYELDIPRIAIRDLFKSFQDDPTNEENFPQFVSKYLIQTYGTDWKERPLLLEGLLDYYHPTQCDVDNPNTRKKLSLQGLLELDQVIPYFEQANQPGVLTPTAKAPVSQIVQAMQNGQPYKIGSQLLVQEHPEWMQELTGTSSTEESSTTGNLLSHLFGNHFSPQHVLPGRFLPATTTVPVFVANLAKNSKQENASSESTRREESNQEETESSCPQDRPPAKTSHITTGLHCEPIGNVAFQMEGSKEWTLVSPKYSSWLQPSLAADGRAFFSSSLEASSNLSATLSRKYVPHWTVVTGPSDALWVPTWTWHRVDYRLLSSTPIRMDHKDDDADVTKDHSIFKNHHAAVDKTELAIGGSIFHFRAGDFLRRNPLYALLIVPALIKELAGISTQ